MNTNTFKGNTAVSVPKQAKKSERLFNALDKLFADLDASACIAWKVHGFLFGETPEEAKTKDGRTGAGMFERAMLQIERCQEKAGDIRNVIEFFNTEI